MKTIFRNIKSISANILILYSVLLLTAAFHHHKIDFYTSPSLTTLVGDVDSGIALTCLFNQINKPNYFYNLSELISTDKQLTDLNFYILENLQTYYPATVSLSPQFRAPPFSN